MYGIFWRKLALKARIQTGVFELIKIIYQEEVELITQIFFQIHAKKQQFSPLFLILSTLLFTPAEILSH